MNNIVVIYTLVSLVLVSSMILRAYFFNKNMLLEKADQTNKPNQTLHDCTDHPQNTQQDVLTGYAQFQQLVYLLVFASMVFSVVYYVIATKAAVSAYSMVIMGIFFLAMWLFGVPLFVKEASAEKGAYEKEQLHDNAP